ncbi:MAG: hypothetical protein NVS3B26_11500 [Mycobacteriales bacterium]
MSGPVVSTIGRLITVKRPDRLLAVAALLPGVTFLVDGEGTLLQQMCRDATPNVRFLGWRGDVEVVHATTGVALLTSDNEGMPVSVVEAALCGTPAVSVVELSRRHGVEAGMQAGVERVVGDWIFELKSGVLDFDLELLARMYEQAARGFEIVTAAGDRGSVRSRLFYASSIATQTSTNRRPRSGSGWRHNAA